MSRVKEISVGFVLLALANISFTQETGATQVNLDYIENVNTVQQGLTAASRIVSGWEAAPGQHPHQVSLRHVSSTGSVSGCGGVLIHRSWVLTAAQCTAGRVSAVVRAGVTNMTTPEYISETSEYYNYPSYDSSRPLEVQADDIALIKLQEPVRYTDLARPIRIQSSEDAFRDYGGELAYTSGFGRTWTSGSSPEVLQWVYLSIITNAECRTYYGTLVTANTICAGPYNVTSQSICQGDSGGPLVHIGDDGVPTLVGIASFVIGGEYGCHSGFPGAFIRPGPFLNWFKEITGLDFENLEEETTTTEVPTTEIPNTTFEPEASSEESYEDIDEDSSEEDSSEEDPELKELLKHLEVQVKVKIKMNKFKKKPKVLNKHSERKIEAQHELIKHSKKKRKAH